MSGLPGSGSSGSSHAESPLQSRPDGLTAELTQVQSHRLRSIPPQPRSARPLPSATESNFESVQGRVGGNPSRELDPR